MGHGLGKRSTCDPDHPGKKNGSTRHNLIRSRALSAAKDDIKL